MSSPAVQSSRREPRPGERWVRVSERGQGLAVDIIKVTNVNVMFQVAQGNRASRSKEGVQTLKIAAFLVNYVPARTESILERQATLRTLTRQPGLAGQGLPSPSVDRAPTPVHAHVTISDNGVATCTCPGFVDRYSVDQTYACDHVIHALRQHALEQSGDEPPGDAAVPAPEPPRAGGRKHRGLTPAQVVEVFLLKGSGTYAEVGRLYGVDGTTVKQIWERTTYRDVTEGLQDPTVAPPRVLLQERKVESRRTQGRFYSVQVWSGGLVTCSCTDYKQNGRECWHVRAIHEPMAGAVPQSDGTILYRPVVEEAPVVAIRPSFDKIEAQQREVREAERQAARMREAVRDALPQAVAPVIARASNDEVVETVREAALYLETLVQYAGQPLPPLMTLDRAKVADIVERLRKIGG